jgi:hypothetical protein
MGSGRPGKFPATVESVSGGRDEQGKVGAHVVLSAAPEDVAYLLQWVGKAVTVDITPASDAPAEPPVGGEPDAGRTPPVPGG